MKAGKRLGLLSAGALLACCAAWHSAGAAARTGSAGTDPPRDGSPLGTEDLPSNAMPEETFRDFAVPDSGGVLSSVRTPEGMTLRRYTCR
jgi:hypothetical protein